MRFSSNSSYVNRIIDSLSKNRVTDFEFEGASPMLRKTISGVNSKFNASFKGKEGRNLAQSFKTISCPRKFQTKEQETSFGSHKQTSFGGQVNSLRLSVGSKSQAGIISGKDIRPDLHRKTYFKGTTSVYIQNSPKTVLKRSPEPRYRHNTKHIRPIVDSEKREGVQAYDGM
jgi:hypothetical protein